MDNDNDLLELYDGNPETEDAYEKTQETAFINAIGALLVCGFLVVIGMIIFKNFYNTTVSREVILLRQVELLNVLKTSANEQEMQQAVNEYDSLARVLEVIDNS